MRDRQGDPPARRGSASRASSRRCSRRGRTGEPGGLRRRRGRGTLRGLDPGWRTVRHAVRRNGLALDRSGCALPQGGRRPRAPRLPRAVGCRPCHPRDGDPFFEELQEVYDEIGEALPPDAHCRGRRSWTTTATRSRRVACSRSSTSRSTTGRRSMTRRLHRPAEHVLGPHRHAGVAARPSLPRDPPTPRDTIRRRGATALGRRPPDRPAPFDLTVGHCAARRAKAGEPRPTRTATSVVGRDREPAAALRQPVGNGDQPAHGWCGAVGRPDEVDGQCRRGAASATRATPCGSW